jgi:hypothetical protein
MISVGMLPRVMARCAAGAALAGAHCRRARRAPIRCRRRRCAGPSSGSRGPQRRDRLGLIRARARLEGGCAGGARRRAGKRDNKRGAGRQPRSTSTLCPSSFAGQSTFRSLYPPTHSQCYDISARNSRNLSISRPERSPTPALQSVPGDSRNFKHFQFVAACEATRIRVSQSRSHFALDYVTPDAMIQVRTTTGSERQSAAGAARAGRRCAFGGRTRPSA